MFKVAATFPMEGMAIGDHERDFRSTFRNSSPKWNLTGFNKTVGDDPDDQNLLQWALFYNALMDANAFQVLILLELPNFFLEG